MINHACFSPDGKYIAIACSNGTIKIVDNETGKLIHSLEGHTDQVSIVEFNPDGRMLLSTSKSSTNIWDIITGNLIRKMMFDC